MTPPSGDWWAVVDTARDERLHPLVLDSPVAQCLIGGEVAMPLAATLPWLVRMRGGEPLADAWQAHGWGRGWGITLWSSAPADAIRISLKRLLHVRLPDGRVVLFRFYDPLIFSRWVDAAGPEDAAMLFRAAGRFMVEDEGARRLRDLSLVDGRIVDAGSDATHLFAAA